MKNDLKAIFQDLLEKYTIDQSQITTLWQEIERAYSGKKRYYHSLEHLNNLYIELDAIKELLEDYDTLLFTLFYHDLVYDPLRKDNEEKSAQIAQKRMESIGISQEQAARCYHQIIATKSHQLSNNSDTNYFTDADLSILGKQWEVYQVYFENVRKEYAMYPDLFYKPGRKKVLKHFLKMTSIFKTTHFIEKYEVQARENLRRELELLS